MIEGTVCFLANLVGLGKTRRFCSEKRPWDVGGGGGRGLLLDVSVKSEIMDFLQPRIKQKTVRIYHNHTRKMCNRY